MISNLKVYRKRAKLSQSSLGWLAGFSDGQRRISHYETGKRRPNLNDCRALVHALNEAGIYCTLDEVFPPSEEQQFEGE